MRGSKWIVGAWLLACSAFIPGAGAGNAAVDEANKLAVTGAWEAWIKSDPKTVAFSKIGDGQYHLETTRVPYSGAVRLSNIVIRHTPDREHGGYTSRATIELTLDVPNRTLAEQYPQSYADWESHNSFYLDSTTEGRWISQADFINRPTQGLEQSTVDAWFVGAISVLLLLLALVWMRVQESRAVRHRYKQADVAEEQIVERFQAMQDRSEEMIAFQQRLLAMHEEQVRLLGELLKATRRRPVS